MPTILQLSDAHLSPRNTLFRKNVELVRRGPAAHVWAPALSFYCPPADQAGLPGNRRPGALLHRLHADHVETVLVAPEGLEAVNIADVQDQTYPRA